MTRRAAIIASALLTGALTAETKAQGGGWGKDWEWHPGSLIFDLRTYTQYTFRLDDRTLTFTPEQVMAALAEEPKP